MKKPANDVKNVQPWASHSIDYDLSDARVVAVLDDGGGAIVEHHAALSIAEGRSEAYGTDGRGQSMSSLDYTLTFNPKDAKIGQSSTGYEASIVITGRTEDGRLMEIRGRGFIGQDELGQLDGQFLELPTVYVPSDEDLAETAAFHAGSSGLSPKGEFLLATYGYGQDWS